MNKKILLPIFVFLLLISSVQGALTDNSKGYWAMEDLTDSSGNGLTLTNEAGATSTTGILNNTYQWNSADGDYFSASKILDTSKAFTVSLWAFKDTDQTQGIINLATQNKVLVYWSGTGKTRLLIDESTIIDYTGTTAVSTWHHIVVTHDGSGNYEMFIGNKSVGSGSGSTFNDSVDMRLGYQYDTPPYLLDGRIDEIGLWQRELSSSEIDELYNNGDGYNPFNEPVIPPVVTEYLDLTAEDNESSTAINSFNVTIDLNNGTTGLYFSTINGSINTGINQSLSLFANLTFRSNNYFDKAYTNYNISNDLKGVLLYKDLIPPTLTTNFQNLTISYYDNLTYDFNFSDGLELETINISIDNNNSVYYTADAGSSTSNQSINYNVNHLSEGIHNLTVFYCDGHGYGCINNKTEHFNFYIGNFTINSTSIALEIENIIMEARVNKNNNYVNNISASLEFNNVTYSPTKTDYENYTFFTQTVPAHLLPNGVNYSSYNVSWNFSIDGFVNDLEKQGTDTITIYKTIITDCNENTTLYNFTFWDEQDRTQHNGSIEANFNFTGNGGTTSAYLDYDNVKEAKVCINEYWSQNFVVDGFVQYNINDSYDSRNYFILGDTLTGISDAENIPLYNIKKTDSNLITFTILDSNGEEMEDTYIHFQRYVPSENGYYLVAHTRTDENGDSGIYLRGYINPDAWYLINIYNSDGVLLHTTTPTIFYSNELEINIGEGGWSVATTPLEDVAGSVIYNNNTKTFIGSFSTITGVPRNVCLTVIERTGAGYMTTLYDECVYSAGVTGGVLSYTIANPENTHNAYLYTYTHSDWNVMNIASYVLQKTPFDLGVIGIFMAFVLILILALIGSFNPVVMLIMGMLGVGISVFMLNLINIGNSVIVTLIIFGGILIIKGSSK